MSGSRAGNKVGLLFADNTDKAFAGFLNENSFPKRQTRREAGAQSHGSVTLIAGLPKEGRRWHLRVGVLLISTRRRIPCEVGVTLMMVQASVKPAL